MATNREEVIDKAFKVFLRMNYEKASISTLAKACGVVKTGVVYYFPHKQDLFMAVAEKFVLQLQNPANKFSRPAETLAGFIDQYVAGVTTAMGRIVDLVVAADTARKTFESWKEYGLSFAFGRGVWHGDPDDCDTAYEIISTLLEKEESPWKQIEW